MDCSHNDERRELRIESPDIVLRATRSPGKIEFEVATRTMEARFATHRDKHSKAIISILTITGTLFV